jgi:spore germination protein KB
MILNEKISSIQLSVMIIGFLYGSTAVLNPAATAYQDSWLAMIIAWVGGFVLLGMYAGISQLNRSKTLVDILIDIFGKYAGGAVALAYVWYFLLLACITLIEFGAYMSSATYEETPEVFIVACLAAVNAYAIRSGLEVVARACELVVPLIPVTAVFVFFMLVSQFDPGNFLPIMDKGIGTVLRTSFEVLTTPFGEAVAFLMIFPSINQTRHLVRVSVISVAVAGMLLLSVTVRALLVLGPDMFANLIFPAQMSSRLIPIINIDPLIAVNLLIGGGVKISVCLYAATIALCQLCGIEDYKPFVLPVTALAIAISVWLFGNIFELFRWSVEIWPFFRCRFRL